MKTSNMNFGLKPEIIGSVLTFEALRKDGENFVKENDGKKLEGYIQLIWSLQGEYGKAGYDLVRA